jgi:glycosyltransferase involved in cell wall biosynthesis
VAIAAITESLILGGHEVKLLSMSTHKHPFDAGKFPETISEQTKAEGVEMDTEVNILSAFRNLFSSRSYNVERFYSRAFEQRLVSILRDQDFDIIHLESIFCTPYLKTIRAHSKAKVVVRAHNVEFRIWEQLATSSSNPLKKWYLSLLARRLRAYEIITLWAVDGIVTISEEDAKNLRELDIICPIEIIPIGFDVTNIPMAQVVTNPIRLYHLGAMDWKPNVEAVRWFALSIWPQVHAKFPEVECHLAGRKMPNEFLSLNVPGLFVEGEIDDVTHFLKDKSICVVPVLSGSGMRIKTAEALAHGKVVISTSLGATGIPFTDQLNMLIANTPSEFADRVQWLLTDRSRIESISKAARTLAEQQFDLKELSSKLTYFYNRIN